MGVPQLSMHSIREMCGTDDVALALQHFTAFFTDFGELDAHMDVDGLQPSDIQGEISDTPCGHIHWQERQHTLSSS